MTHNVTSRDTTPEHQLTSSHMTPRSALGTAECNPVGTTRHDTALHCTTTRAVIPHLTRETRYHNIISRDTTSPHA